MKKLAVILAVAVSSLLASGPLAAQEAIVHLDQANAQSAFVDVGGGVKVSTVEVRGKLQSLSFVVVFVEGNPVVEFLSPQGELVSLDSARVQLLRTEWGLMAGVKDPELGVWTLRLSQTLGESSYQVKVITIPALPTMSLTTPSFSQEPWSSPVIIGGQTQPDQEGRTVRIQIKTSDEGGGLVAGETRVLADGSFTYLLDPSEYSAGEYRVLAALDTGDGPAINAVAPGSLMRTQPSRLGPVTGLAALVEQPSTLHVSFAADYGRRPATFRVTLTSSSGKTQVVDIGGQTKARLTGFEPGRAQVRVSGIDSDGREGESSPVLEVEFGAPTPAVPQLTLAPVAPLPLDLSVGQSTANFRLVGDLGSFPASTALIEAVIGTLPAGLDVMPAQAQWTLPGQASQLALRLSARIDLVPGHYSIPVEFRTVGVPENFVRGVLELEVFRPEPAVTQVRPSSWNLDQRPELLVLGQNFLTGTRVFFDGLELTLKGMKPNELSLSVPEGLAAGVHQLVVRNLDGVEASAPLTVLNPNYVLIATKSVSKVMPGGTSRYWIGAKAINGYQGKATLSITVPEGWSAAADPVEVADEVVSTISVQVPQAALPGDYTVQVRTNEGGVVDLKTTVMTSQPDPFLSSMAPFAELVGGTVAMFGYGFGTQPGTIAVDDQTWTPETWSDDLVTVKVPSGGRSGLLRVRTAAGRLTNGITLGVKDYGFQFHTNQLEFRLQGGETKALEIQLTGHPEPINLQAQALSPMVHLGTVPTAVTPLGLAVLTIAVDKDIPIGRYPVTLTGTSGYYQTNLELVVVVGEALEFANPGLANAMRGTIYAAQLAALHPEGSVEFSLADGVLPRGLSLSPQGKLSGKAQETGVFRLILQVKDQGGHTTQKEYSLTVEETGWGFPARDESASAHSPVDAPADGRVLWSASVDSSPLRAFLAGGNSLYAQTSGGISALYAPKGTPLFQITAEVKDLKLVQGRLFAVDGNVVHAWEPGFGNELWNRPGGRYWAKAGTVLVENSGTVDVIDATLGTLSAQLAADLSGHLFGWKGELLRLLGNQLEIWSDTAGWSTLYQNPVELTGAAGDAESLLLWDSLGQVKLWDGTSARELWSGPVAQLSVASEFLVVDTGTSLEVRDREGHLVRSWTGGGYDQIFTSREKLFTVGQGVLQVRNLTSGALIWQTAADAGLLSGDRLYTLDAQGTLRAHHAPDNLKAPETSLVTVPAQPNGTNSWFTVAPQVMLNATDVETYAQTTDWKLGAAEWAPYAPVTLGDGVHSLAWHSIDNAGKQEADRMAVLMVDTTPPISTLSASPGPLASLPAAFGAPVTLTLTAGDELSGLARIEYQWDLGAWQTYSSPLALDVQKAYSLTYRAVDQAGNTETARTFAFHLDYQDPAATAELDSRDEAAFVFLAGTDPGTGIARLEYKIGDGPVTTYQDVVPFLTTGRWTLAYRAVDHAGRTSAWKTIEVRNQGPAADQRVSKIEYHKDVKGRDNEFPIAVGEAIFTNSKDKFLSLPPEVIGGLYLRHRDTDAQSTASTYTTLTFRGPAQVYYLQESDSKVVLTGWTKGALIPAGTVSKSYFKGGLQLWTKSYQGGEKAIFGGPGLKHTGGDLIFVQAPWVGISILKPAPGATLSPGQSLTLQALTGPAGAEVTWTLGEGRRAVALGKGNPLTATLPAGLEGRNVELKVSITVGSRTYEDQARFDLRLPEKLTILYPGPRFPVKQGASLKPVTLWRDSQGRPGKAPAVTWTLKKGDQVLYQGASPIPVSAAGPLTLTGTATGSAGQVVTAATTFPTVAEWPWVKWKWRDKGHKEWRDDDGEGFWGGQHAEDDHREAQLGSRKTTLDVWKWTKDADYRVSLADGTYEVTLIVGPFKAWEVHSLIVNEQALNLTAKKNGEVMRLRFVVKVTDGTLSIKGTAGLPVYRLDYRRSSDNTPLSAALDKTLDSPEDLE